MREYRFSDALNYNHARLSEMHNASFQGYFVPLEMTARMSADFWRVNQVDAALSVVMHEREGAFVGLARVGSRGKRGWCGGFGIVPDFRGSGASTLLAEEMVRVARANDLETIQLEVLAQNVRAIKLYEKVGFVKTRRLFGLEIASAALATDAATQVERVSVEELLPAFHRGPRPAWSNELPALLSMNLEAFALTGAGGERSGILVQHANGKMRVVAALLREAITTAEVSALLKAAAGDAQSVQVYNEGEGSLFLEHCQHLGFGEWFTQYEMSMPLQTAS
jgi:ribosomal protein S18 acetylase RimI-like enzyme